MSDLLYKVTYFDNKGKEQTTELLAKNESNAITRALMMDDVVIVKDIEEVH
ncbi:hypothetical protein [Bacillus cereus]|uniref:hypothetical protein n=1 Tax=Bacillus cereus TaxID=1396 RepID=UPI000AA15842|nr:hypothetical protein [Bacillus cereus]